MKNHLKQITPFIYRYPTTYIDHPKWPLFISYQSMHHEQFIPIRSMNNRMIPDIDRNTTTTTLKSPNPSKPIIPLTNQPTLPPYPQNPPNKPHPLISRKGPVGPCYNRNHISPSPPSPPPPSPPPPPPSFRRQRGRCPSPWFVPS